MPTKKVLIVTDVFPPGFAPRMGYLSKYLKEFNWDAVALSPLYDRENNTFDFLSGYIPFESITISKEAESSEYKRNIFQKFFSIWFTELIVSRKLRKEMFAKGEEILKRNTISIILCSTSNIFPLHIAYKLSRKYNIPWITDLRDITEEYTIKDSFLKELRNVFIVKQRNFFIKHATAVVAVSKPHVDILSKWNANTFLIYNGYDSELFKYAIPKKCNQFKIVYTGAVSIGGVDRDPSMFFSAVRKMKNENRIDNEKFRIQFYTDLKSQEILTTLALRFEINEFVDCFNYVPSTEVPDILSEASILLLLTHGKGIMTTKLFEYFAVGRPVLCVRSDEDAIEELIEELHAGMAARTELDAYNFLRKCHEEWKLLGYTNSTTNPEKIKKYSRQLQAGQFVEFFDRFKKA